YPRGIRESHEPSRAGRSAPLPGRHQRARDPLAVRLGDVREQGGAARGQSLRDHHRRARSTDRDGPPGALARRPEADLPRDRLMDLVVRGGTVVTAAGSFQADVGIEGGRIVELGTVGGDAPALDATGKFVLPGGVDVHTHLRLPTPEAPDRLYQDTVAAACGGTTTVLSFIEQPRGGSPLGTLDKWRQGAASEAAVDYGFHVILTEFSE